MAGQLIDEIIFGSLDVCSLMTRRRPDYREQRIVGRTMPANLVGISVAGSKFAAQPSSSQYANQLIGLVRTQTQCPSIAETDLDRVKP